VVPHAAVFSSLRTHRRTHPSDRCCRSSERRARRRLRSQTLDRTPSKGVNRARAIGPLCHSVPLHRIAEGRELVPDNTTDAKDQLPQLLLRVEEVAEVLGVSRGTVYKLIQDRHLIRVKIGSSTRIPMKSVERYVEGLHQEARKALAKVPAGVR